MLHKNVTQKNTFCLFFIIFILLYASALQAQIANTEDKSFQIPKVDLAPQLDGRLSPGEWDNAAVIEDLYEVRPVEFSEADKRTVFSFMYTEDALYISAYVYDDPAQLTAKVLRHESTLRDEDRIAVILDPFNNKRSGYIFQTNPNGVRHEGIYTSATGQSWDWATIWDVASSVVADGWITEIEIPFKSITFDPENPTWGVNVYRQKVSNQTRMGWISYNGQQNPSVAGEMTGFSNLNQGVGLDIIPSLSAVQLNDRAAGNKQSDVKPSFDMTYKLTSSLNLSLTFNTDFAATEVDNIQLDVGRFSTRLPEKRSFFLTDMDIFNFGAGGGGGGFPGGGGGGGGPPGFGGGGPDPFNSRNIGLSSTGEPVDLVAGAKLSGRIGGYDVGTLIIHQDEFNNIDATDIFVGRVKHSLLAESEIGAIYTYGDPSSNDTSSTAGLDFNYRNNRLANNRSLQSSLWIQRSNNPGTNSDNLAWHADIDFPSSDSWFVSAKIEEVQENFDPRLGFSNRTGVRQYNTALGNSWIFREHSLIRKYTTRLDVTQYDYLDTGNLQSRTLLLDLLNLESVSGGMAVFGVNRQTQVLRDGERAPLSQLGISILPGEYSFTRYMGIINSSRARSFSAGLFGSFGDYYTGTDWDLSASVSWKPSKHLSFDLNYSYHEYDMPEAKVNTRVVELENVITISPSLSLVNIVQYENVFDTLGFNARLRWNLQSGQDVWFVLSHGMEDFDEDGEFNSLETSATFKIRYTMRY